MAKSAYNMFMPDIDGWTDNKDTIICPVYD